jgi:lactate permease
MVKTGMMRLLASALAPLAGAFYPFLAVAVGALGSFMTGTNLGSNIMFGPMHVQAAVSLGQNPITVFAGQNAGGSIGNMICPNNVVAVATTVGILGKEGVLMRRVFPAFFVFLITYGLVSLLYTHLLFKR